MASAVLKRTIKSIKFNRNSYQTVRLFSSAPLQSADNAPSSDSKEATTVTKVEDLPPVEKEKYVPLTTRTLIRHLIQHKHSQNKESIDDFHQFAARLDSAVIKKYHGIFQDLKTLFAPLNPDSEEENALGRREKLDSEFWLLEKLDKIMQLANFEELSRDKLNAVLHEHTTKSGLLISVRTERYDVLRMWTLVRQKPREYESFVHSLLKTVGLKSSASSDYYRRLVLAVRLKTEDKLLLKAFRDVPINSLELTLPDGVVKMSRVESSLLAATGAAGLLGVATELIGHLLHHHLMWPVGVTAASAAAGVTLWLSFLSRQRTYLQERVRLLHYKNITNNLTLLDLLVRRAQDELLKQCLLAYTFLQQHDSLSADKGAIPVAELERLVEEWLFSKTGRMVKFESSEPVKVLAELGIVSVQPDDMLLVTSLDKAVRSLPFTLSSLTEREVVEGLELGDAKEHKQEQRLDKKRRRFGWF